MIYTVDLCDIKIVQWETIEEAKESIGYLHPDDTFTRRIDALEYLRDAIEEDQEVQQIALEEAMHAEHYLEQYEHELPKIKAEIRALLTKKRSKKSAT